MSPTSNLYERRPARGVLDWLKGTVTNLPTQAVEAVQHAWNGRVHPAYERVPVDDIENAMELVEARPDSEQSYSLRFRYLSLQISSDLAKRQAEEAALQQRIDQATQVFRDNMKTAREAQIDARDARIAGLDPNIPADQAQIDNINAAADTQDEQYYRQLADLPKDLKALVHDDTLALSVMRQQNKDWLAEQLRQKDALHQLVKRETAVEHGAAVPQHKVNIPFDPMTLEKREYDKLVSFNPDKFPKIKTHAVPIRTNLEKDKPVTDTTIFAVPMVVDGEKTYLRYFPDMDNPTCGKVVADGFEGLSESFEYDFIKQQWTTSEDAHNTLRAEIIRLHRDLAMLQDREDVRSLHYDANRTVASSIVREMELAIQSLAQGRSEYSEILDAMQKAEKSLADLIKDDTKAVRDKWSGDQSKYVAASMALLAMTLVTHRFMGTTFSAPVGSIGGAGILSGAAAQYPWKRSTASTAAPPAAPGATP